MLDFRAWARWSLAHEVEAFAVAIAAGPGEAAGLKPGDVITAINGKPPADDPNDPAFLQAVGTELELRVRRVGVERLYRVSLRDVR